MMSIASNLTKLGLHLTSDFLKKMSAWFVPVARLTHCQFELQKCYGKVRVVQRELSAEFAELLQKDNDDPEVS